MAATPKLKYLTDRQCTLLKALLNLKLTELIISNDNPLLIQEYQDTYARLDRG